MQTIAAVITGRANAAISAIAVSGDNCRAVCSDITRGGFAGVPVGGYRLCRIYDGDKEIDEVLIGRESDDCCVINCHGNPIIIEAITAYLARSGAAVVSCGDYIIDRLSDKCGLLAAEVKLRQCGAECVEAVRLLHKQLSGGLTAFVRGCLQSAVIDVDGLHRRCAKIIADSDTAEKMLRRLRVVLAGNPNSGKSTLFNRFCGKEAAIVTDKRGTTRDWISARCRIGALSVELVDTAGLDGGLCNKDIDRQSQEKTAQLLQSADIVLIVMDINSAQDLQNSRPIASMCTRGAVIINVYNKSDLAPAFAAADGVVISAANESNIDGLTKRIVEAAGIETLDDDAAICFTSRQRMLVEQILNTGSEEKIRDILERIIC